MIAVELQHVTKRFGGLTANDDVSFSVEHGTIHALVGENGAGKSTLMRVVYGMEHAEAGTILIDGRPEEIAGPAGAIRLGIGMVHQHFMLIPPLSVAENVILGSEPPSRCGLLDLPRASASVRALGEKFGLTVDPDARVETLSVGMQQRIEILKILYRNARILILDEPTAMLTPQEVEALFATLRTFKKAGKTVVLITHRLREVKDISDRVTVLRRGRVVGSVDTAATNERELARMIVGKDLEPQSSARAPERSEEILSVRHLSVENDRGLPAVRDVSFSIHAREIFGIAAVEGNGQQELVQAIAGLRSPASGTIRIAGTPAGARPSVAHIPEDRISMGMIPAFSIAENLILGRHRDPVFSRPLWFRRHAVEEFAAAKTREFDIRNVSRRRTMAALSGGNQQKVVVARELSKNTPLIIANHPARGLDVSAVGFVHDSLLSAREQGRAILLLSADLAELLALSDRIAVMYRGEIVALLPAREATERELGEFMTGIHARAV